MTNHRNPETLWPVVSTLPRRSLTATIGGKESVGLFRIRGIRVVRVHHLFDAPHCEHLGGIRRPGNERFERIAFITLEGREDVVRQISPRITASYPQPQ